MYNPTLTSNQLYVRVLLDCVDPVEATCPVTTLPTAGTWTKIKMAVGAGQTSLTFNDISVLSGSCPGALCSDPIATVSVGAAGGSLWYDFFYDNLAVSVQR